MKKSYKNNKFKLSTTAGMNTLNTLNHLMDALNYLMDLILFLIFKIILESNFHSIKKHGTFTDKTPIQI